MMAKMEAMVQIWDACWMRELAVEPMVFELCLLSIKVCEHSFLLCFCVDFVRKLSGLSSVYY